MASYVKLFLKLCYHQISPRYCCIRLGYCDLITPLSATCLAIMPHKSFQLRSGYWNSAPIMCAPSIGKNIGTKGSYMSFEACESRILIHSVPFPSLGISGALCLLISYLIVLQLFRWFITDRSCQFQLFQFYFWGIKFPSFYI